MRKFLVPAAVVLAAVASIASASEPKVNAEMMPASFVVHQLAAMGLEARAIDWERDAYKVKVRRSDGSLAKGVVDLRDGRLWPVVPVVATGKADTAPVLALPATVIVQLLDAAGYPVLEAMAFDDGVWKAEVRDRSGTHVHKSVDPVSGSVF